jgi:hypothetical protein
MPSSAETYRFVPPFFFLLFEITSNKNTRMKNNYIPKKKKMPALTPCLANISINTNPSTMLVVLLLP